MEFGMSSRIKPKEKYVRNSMKEIWGNLDGPPKQRMWTYMVDGSARAVLGATPIYACYKV